MLYVCKKLSNLVFTSVTRLVAENPNQLRLLKPCLAKIIENRTQHNIVIFAIKIEGYKDNEYIVDQELLSYILQITKLKELVLEKGIYNKKNPLLTFLLR